MLRNPWHSAVALFAVSYADLNGCAFEDCGDGSATAALMRAAGTARKIDPELAQVYWRLMTTRGHHHKQALCAAANRLVNRILSVLRRGQPYALRDPDGRELSVAEAKALVLQRFTVPDQVRASRRANRTPVAA